MSHEVFTCLREGAALVLLLDDAVLRKICQSLTSAVRGYPETGFLEERSDMDFVSRNRHRLGEPAIRPLLSPL